MSGEHSLRDVAEFIHETIDFNAVVVSELDVNRRDEGHRTQADHIIRGRHTIPMMTMSNRYPSW